MMVANDCSPQINDILVAKDGSYLKHVFIVNENRKEAILSSIAIFRPNLSTICPELLLCLLKNQDVQRVIKDNYVSGSALPRIVLKDFKKLKFVLPPHTEQAKFSAFYSSLRYRIAENQLESNCLSVLRDSLLPRFMNGEIEVEEKK
jgi:type I restriction enzyme S subunit